MPVTPSTPTTEPVIRLEDVTVVSAVDPRVEILQGVHWRINAGDFWVIAGLHSTGKSDLLMTAAGLTKPARGGHFLFGKNTRGLTGDELLPERLRMGFVFENGGRLFMDMTVEQNVALPLCYHRDCSPDDLTTEIQTVLDLLGIAFLRDHPAYRISRAWRQRIGLARALILRPEVLIIDNPITGVDPRQAAWWLNFLDQLAAGHEYFDRQPLTLVTTAGTLNPWVHRGRQFGILDGNRWFTLGSQDELSNSNNPLIRELLTQSQPGI